jgi:hypothetical protein
VNVLLRAFHGVRHDLLCCLLQGVVHLHISHQTSCSHSLQRRTLLWSHFTRAGSGGCRWTGTNMFIFFSNMVCLSFQQLRSTHSAVFAVDKFLKREGKNLHVCSFYMNCMNSTNNKAFAIGSSEVTTHSSDCIILHYNLASKLSAS